MQFCSASRERACPVNAPVVDIFPSVYQRYKTTIDCNRHLPYRVGTFDKIRQPMCCLCISFNLIHLAHCYPGDKMRFKLVQPGRKSMYAYAIRRQARAALCASTFAISVLGFGTPALFGAGPNNAAHSIKTATPIKQRGHYCGRESQL